jgi:hypothetical protein
VPARVPARATSAIDEGLDVRPVRSSARRYRSTTTEQQHTSDSLHYGMPRTFQMDEVVGHQDSPAHPSHFIALNLDGHLEVIELAAGKPAHAHIYVGPTQTGAEAAQVPVTIQFQDVNGDGRPDLLLLFNGIQVVYLNTGTSFQPLHL